MEATALFSPALSPALRGALITLWFLAWGSLTGEDSGTQSIAYRGRAYALFPNAFAKRPELPSPFQSLENLELVTVRTEQDRYVLVPVTVIPGITIRPWEAPLEVDGEDFPTLARKGRHAEAELDRTRSITGRSLEEISELGRPGRLSSSGFLAEDEDILSVLKHDNRIVTRLGLTHAELARPLLRICNLLRVIHQETGQRHTNTLFYGDKTLKLEIEFSRGGQKSIFDDGLDGAWTIEIRGAMEPAERALINRVYGKLGPEQRDTVHARLTHLLTGEMQPFYIYRYGFYEGHTAWRTDPVSIAYLFGLRSLEQIEAAFPGQLHSVLTQHAVREASPPAQRVEKPRSEKPRSTPVTAVIPE